MKPSLSCVAAALALSACIGGEATPVGVTLDDGQLLIGDITTPDLVLTGTFGTVAIPLDDVGMVVPVEGRTLAESGGQVTVWLRNGSELRGEWDEPELAIGIDVGGKQVGIDLPAGRMQALQLRGQEHWPEDGLYRVRTTWGDDFLVDPAATRIEVHNELGTFAPFLSECRSVGPISNPEGDWRIELDTGTVLIGPLKTDQIQFALPMGPEIIDVDAGDLVALVRGAWIDQGDAGGGRWFGSNAVAPAAAAEAPAQQKAPRARPGLSSSDGWFDGQAMENAKR